MASLTYELHSNASPSQHGSDALFTLWLIDWSVAMFIGHSGEARVGSGCDDSLGPSGQAFRTTCSGVGEQDERYCRFYTGSNGIRRYLAMRDSGALETLAVPEETWGSYLKSSSVPLTKNRPRIETLFKVAPHFDCKGDTECETVSLSSFSTGKYVHVSGNPHHKNLTKLHHKAVVNLESAQGSKSSCFKNPGPFYQNVNNKAPTFRFKSLQEQPLQCRKAPFTELICPTGSLRASYPIQNPVRAASKAK